MAHKQSSSATVPLDTVRSTWLRTLTDRTLYDVPVGCRWRIHFVDALQVSRRRHQFKAPDLDYRLTEDVFLRRFVQPGRYWFEPFTADGRRIARVLAFYDRAAE